MGDQLNEQQCIKYNKRYGFNGFGVYLYEQSN